MSPTGSATPTATASTPAWWRSRTPTTQPTFSGSTRTSGPATPRQSLRLPSAQAGRAALIPCTRASGCHRVAHGAEQDLRAEFDIVAEADQVPSHVHDL